MTPARAVAAVVGVLLATAITGCGGSTKTGAPTTAATGTAARVAADARWVAPGGADANPGTKDAPWATIDGALAKMAPGQTLVVAAGTYAEQVRATVSGSADAPILVQAAPGASPVIHPAGSDSVIEVGSGAGYVIFDGLTFEGARGDSSADIYVSGTAHDITFRNCVARGSDRQGFFSERTTSNVVVDGCTFSGNGGEGPDNLDHNLYVEGSGHRIVNNVIVGAANGYGIQVYPVAHDIAVVNNTIVGNRAGIVVGAEEGGQTHDVTIANNIVAFNQRTGIAPYWGDGMAGTGNVVRNNVFFRNRGGDLDRSVPGLRYVGNRIGDPKFVDRAAGDFRLGKGSAADGLAAPALVPQTDSRGTSRSRSAPDAGAFEG